MTPYAHLIGYDYSVYTDIIAVVVALCLGMIVGTVWLVSQKRSYRFITAVWGGFVLLMCLGTFGMFTFIYHQRIDWSDYCSKLIAYYADMIGRLDHWKIQPGNPDFFSDWTYPIVVSFDQRTGTLLGRDKWLALDDEQPDQSPISERLAVPEGLAADWGNVLPDPNMPTHVQRRNQWAVAELTQDSHAFDRSTKHIYVRWNSVPQATAYRLQWRDDNCNDADWMTVYTGARPFCILTVPDGITLALRVRAEDGTPEDDPHFSQIIETLYFPTATNIYVGYAYTMRYAAPGYSQFIVAPISDADHNGVIDANEMPNDIGELYPATPIFLHVLNYKERAMDFGIYEDQWGQWFIIAEPIWTPDNEFDGLLAIDFRADAVLRAMFYERIYPLCLFVLVITVYFGAILFVNSIQIKASLVSQLAGKLQHTVSELTEAKHEAEKALQVKTLFLTNMSHEFRTPLNAILGFIGLLEQSSFQCIADERAMCVEAIKQVKANGKSLLKLVDNILDVAAMANTQTSQLEFVLMHLRNLIFEVADMMQSRAEYKSLTLTVDEPQNVPEWIMSDPRHIRQVLILLVDNAIKFTQEGSVVIRYGILPERQSSNMPIFYVLVSDTGIGIAADHLKSIFKPFSQVDLTSTREYSGAGLGLAVARQAAEMLGGNISVESQPGKGSVFTFTFPGQIPKPPLQEGSKTPSTAFSQTKPAAGTAEPSQSGILMASRTMQSLTGCRILYVEDTKVNQIVMAEQLEATGAVVETAENGQIGIDKIREAEARGEPFDIILMDMQMPVLDGYKAVQHLRAHGYFKPIIAVTAHALPEDRKKTLEAGCDDHITKPVDFARLTEVIKRFSWGD